MLENTANKQAVELATVPDQLDEGLTLEMSHIARRLGSCSRLVQAPACCFRGDPESMAVDQGQAAS